jgi:hypothetical protein
MEWTFLRKKIRYAEEKDLIINQLRLRSSEMYTLQNGGWAPGERCAKGSGGET